MMDEKGADLSERAAVAMSSFLIDLPVELLPAFRRAVALNTAFVYQRASQLADGCRDGWRQASENQTLSGPQARKLLDKSLGAEAIAEQLRLRAYDAEMEAGG
jgi:hypothetical protein